MDIYKYRYKRKNIKLRRFLFFAILFLVIYLFVKNWHRINIFSKSDYQFSEIENLIKKSESEKNLKEKRILIQKVLSKLNKILESEKNPSSELYFLLGRSYLQRALLEYNNEIRDMLLDKSLFFYRKALALSKDDNPLIHFELGKCYFYKGEYYYYESVMELEKSKKLGFYSEDIDKIINFILYKKGSITEISQLFQNFKLSKPESIERIFYDAYKLKDNNDFTNSKKNFLKIAEYFSSRPVQSEEEKYILFRTYFALGWLYLNEKNFNKSEEFYKMALKMDSNSYEIYYWLGKLYYIKKDYNKAKKMFKLSLDLNPGYKPAEEKLKLLNRRR